MSSPKYLLFYLIIPSLGVLFYYANNYFEFFRTFSVPVDSEILLLKLYSSGFCRGSNHTNRICHFKNLCYDPNSQLFIFLHSEKSVKSGLPFDRFSPALLDFSSVYDHNTQYFNFVDLPSTAVSKFNVSFFRGNFLIFKRFNPDNLMHVFHDDLIPSFSTLNEIYPHEDIKYRNVSFIFADHREPGPYQDIYENFLFGKPLYVKSLPNKNLHCFQTSHIGLNKNSIWYQYGFTEPQGPFLKSNLEVAPIILAFREYFQQKYQMKISNQEKCAVLLSRKHNRKLLNENELKVTITETIGFNTFVMSLEQNSVLEIIKKILECEMLIGMHGSLLILSLFSKPFSSIVELFPYGVFPNISTPYKTLASLPGMNLIYQAWENKFQVNSFPHPEYLPELGGILQFSVEKQTQIKNSIVTPFLCCDNPVWLYRIYQDTVVDISSFKKTLLDSLNNKENFQKKERMAPYNIYPSEVQHSSCDISLNTSNVLNIHWNSPWNIAFINVDIIEYEVWIQATDSRDVQAFITKKNHFQLKADLSVNMYFVWIRCIANGLVGPFISSPLLCD